MRTTRVAMAFFCGAALLWNASVVADDHEHSHKLPPGPIHDRHELMEEIGKHAKKIGEAGKAGNKKAIVPEAEAIAAKSKKAAALSRRAALIPSHARNRRSGKIGRSSRLIWRALDKAATQFGQGSRRGR